MNGKAVLDVGGTHVTAAVVDTTTWSSLPGSRHRYPLRSDGTAEQIIATIAACMQTLGSLAGEAVTIALPGPFDYNAGIGRYEGVEKFEALNGVDVRERLFRAMAEPPRSIEFLNDAAAFGIGEWVAGATKGSQRSVAVTLGTGVGSAFVDAGVAIESGPLVPPDGEVHLLQINGRPLEDVVSRRAIIARYRNTAHEVVDVGIDVRDIAERAASGDEAAQRAVEEPCRALGLALAPWLGRFCAEALVFGGGIAAAWPMIEPPIREGLEKGGVEPARVRVVRSTNFEESVEVGAAWSSHRLDLRGANE
jgi:predicted NBD/HSP70 family sugar kinase